MCWARGELWLKQQARCSIRNHPHPMPITIDHFSSLKQRFPTWAELRAHLESPAGGALRIVEPSAGQLAARPELAPFVVIRYVKGKSNIGSAELGTGLFRSVVWNTATNNPVLMAPPKAREGVPPAGVQLAATEDFVDGVMVNFFVTFVNGNAVASITTRTTLDGSGTFYSEKSFATMFEEAVATTPFKTVAALRGALVNALDWQGPGSIFASFVLQHPDHRVVMKITDPALYCVHLGRVEENGTVLLEERPAAWPQGFARLQVPSYPLRRFNTEQEVEDLLRKTAVQRGWRWQGLVFKDGQGQRWRLRSPTYTMLRELRGGEATDEDRFLRLRSEGKMMEYLKHYGEDRKKFWDLEQTMRARTMDVLTAYVDVHKAHAVSFKELPAEYKPAVYLLHLKWLNELRGRGFSCRIQNAVAVVNSMKPFEQRRLMEAAPYEAKATAPKPSEAEEQTEQEDALEEQEEPQA